MSKKDLDTVLESEIGSMGSDEHTTGLGKLKNKAAYGQKADLDEDDQASLDRFLNRGKAIKNSIENEEAATVSTGWIPIDRKDMGVRSQFYPEGWQFFVKPATVKAIKSWTSIDESRPDQVNKVFNEIIRQCVKIDTGAEQGAGWAQIRSWDRFWFILKVREYTFAVGESKIEYSDECTECGEDITYTLTADALHYEFPDDSLIDEYWNGKEWDIDPRTYDVDHDPIKLYTPTLGKDDAIIEWASTRVRGGGKIDETFIEFLIWMLDKPSRDMQMLDRQIEKLHKEYNSWSVEMFSFMKDVLRNITINPSENLSTRCPRCGRETVSGVQFPDGVTALFNANKPKKKFGTR